MGANVVHAYLSSGLLDTNAYHAKVVALLDSAYSKNLMVIVPMGIFSFMINSKPPYWYLNKVVGDSYIRNHPALLGWYGDEADNEGDSAFSGWRTQYLNHQPTSCDTALQNWYTCLKAYDPNHPFFLVMSSKIKFDSMYSAPDRIYDVLMGDYFPMMPGDGDPSNDLGLNESICANLSLRWFQDNKNGSIGSTMFVPQGRNLVDCQPGGRPDPGPATIKYQVFDFLTRAQSDGASNSGGILWWWDQAMDASLFNNMKYFTQFFTGHHLDAVQRQQNLNSLITYVGGDAQNILCFLRDYKDTLYLFSVNTCNTLRHPSFTLRIGGYSGNWSEIRVPPLNDLTITNITPQGSGQFSFTDNSFIGYGSKVYRIPSDLHVSMSGPTQIQDPKSKGTNSYYTWQAAVRGGSGSYNYTWYESGSPVGTNSSSYTKACQWDGSGSNYLTTYTLSLKVTDTGYRTGASQLDITEYASGYIFPQIIVRGANTPQGKSTQIGKTAQSGVFPNPFNPSTIFAYQIGNPSLVEIIVYNTLGQKVAALFSGRQEEGSYQARFDGTNLASGIYFLRFISTEQSGGLTRNEVHKLLLAK
jgi:hypothetical protein